MRKSFVGHKVASFDKIVSLLDWRKKTEGAEVPKKVQEKKEIAPEVRVQAQAMELALAAVQEYERIKKRAFRKKAFWSVLVAVVATAALLNWSGRGESGYKYNISKTTFRSFTAAGLAGTSGGVLAMGATKVAVAGSGGRGSIAFIPIRDGIGGGLYDPPSPENSVLYLAEALDVAKKITSLAGVMLYINSGGGGAVASAQSCRLVKEFRAQMKLPVVAFVDNSAYSGGYYIAACADRIIADPDAGVGSIGVIMSFFNTHELGSLLGMMENNITTGVHKDAGSKWKKKNEFDQEMMRRSMNPMFRNFLKEVSSGRGIPLADLEKETQAFMGRSSGAWFSAEDALAKKLIDGEMTGEELFRKFAKDLITEKGYSEIELLRFERQVAPEEKKAKENALYARTLAREILPEVLREFSRSRRELRAE